MSQIKQLTNKYGKELGSKLLDPVFFIEEVIYKPKKWILTPYHREWLFLSQKHKKINITAFRSSGKTELLLISQGIWRAFKQSKFDGAIISNSLKQSTEILKRTRDAILENEVLRSSMDSGKFAQQNQTTLTLKNGARLRCLPYNNNVRMNHFNWVGCDEIGLYRDHGLMRSAISPTLTAKNGDLNCIGTPMTKIDLIHKLRENKAYISKIYPAWTDKVNLFKQRYPEREVRVINGKYQIIDEKGNIFDEYNSLDWNREFMCVPLGSEDNIYPYELLEASFKYDLRMSTELNTNSRYYIGVDFALSAESSADYTVIIILERTKEGKLILANMIRWKGMSYNAQKIRIAEVLSYYRPVRAVLDEGSFGASFLDDLRRMVKGVGIEGLRFTSGPYTKVKQDVITMLRSTFESNWEVYNSNEKIPLPEDKKNFFIPKDPTDTRTTKLVNDIMDELLSFGIKYDEEKHTVKFEGIGSHDDIVIALGLANYAAYNSGMIKPSVLRGSAGYRKSLVRKTR